MQPHQSINAKHLESVIGKGVTLVDFNAPWCAPCRAQEPILKDLSEKFNGKATIIAFNVDENQKFAIDLGIASIPTLIIFKNGNEVTRFVGLQCAASLSDAIEKALD